MLILSQSPKGPVELTFFQPQPQELYLTDPREQRGIHCRFGMPGIMQKTILIPVRMLLLC
jgi:hypothetical protein